jgi:hypothetical protein
MTGTTSWGACARLLAMLSDINAACFQKNQMHHPSHANCKKTKSSIQFKFMNEHHTHNKITKYKCATSTTFIL